MVKPQMRLAVSFATPIINFVSPYVAYFYFVAVPGFTAAARNTIYYRGSSSPSTKDAERMASDVAASLPLEAPFTASFLAVVTWFAVSHHYDNRGGKTKTDKLNTFQAALASDTSGRSFVTLW